ncbi:DNA-processing protein DprA [Ornithinibacillus halophilus]|nr:DNA-processing protein DprA [Ornithinibacillus halophilus]
MNRRMIRLLLRYDPTLKDIFHFSSPTLSKFFSISIEKANLLHKSLHDEQLYRNTLQEQKNVDIITIVDDGYPPMLKTIKDAPLILYMVGDRSLMHQKPVLSIIGTRKPSDEGMLKVKHYIKPLVDRNWVIASGMARGIDSFAHKLTLAYNGKTIAVLGSGFNKIYPKENISLFKQIIKNGLVISEYPPDTPPKPFHFPERNRIISGLSFGTLVIEATEKSGTLITVDQALDQGREVYAVPGSPLTPQTKGCHQMIQDGAKLVLNGEDIIEDWENVYKKW